MWQGPDHLLSISRHWGSERYKRYYFDDVQAFIIRKTGLGKIQNVTCAILSGIFSVCAIHFGGIAAWPLGALAAITALVLVVNALRGPTCAFHIQTAVRTEHLASVNRMKTAGRLLSILKPLIGRRQGALTSSRLQQEWALRPGPTEERPDRSAGPVPASASHYNLHTWAFGLLVLLATANALFYFHQHVVVTLVETAALLATVVMVIMALTRQYRYRMADGIRRLTWASAVFTGLYLAGGYAIFIHVVMKDPRLIQNQWEMIKHGSSLAPSSHPLLLGINLFTVGSALVLGIWGLVLVKRSRMQIRP